MKEVALAPLFRFFIRCSISGRRQKFNIAKLEGFRMEPLGTASWAANGPALPVRDSQFLTADSANYDRQTPLQMTEVSAGLHIIG
jgi:hypothetical protein